MNCTFLGANTEAPQYYGNDNRHRNIPVRTQDRVDNFFLAGNTFSRFFGQSMFRTYGFDKVEAPYTSYSTTVEMGRALHRPARERARLRKVEAPSSRVRLDVVIPIDQPGRR